MATPKKKPSHAQIAARKKFAERARAGTLKNAGALKKGARKSNPTSAVYKRDNKGLAKNPAKPKVVASNAYWVIEINFASGAIEYFKSWDVKCGHLKDADLKTTAAHHSALHYLRDGDAERDMALMAPHFAAFRPVKIHQVKTVKVTGK